MNLRRLDAYFRRLVEEGLLPGAVVLVARGGEVVFQGVYGYLDPGRGLPMREDALFRLYSMTKPWVSALALSFVEEGTLSLLDPVEKYLPEFSGLRVGREVGEGIVYEPLKRPLTVYDLLRHTAGLTYGVFFRSPVKGLYLRAGVDRFDLSREVFWSASPRCLCASSPGRPLSTASPPTSSATSWRLWRGGAWRSFWRNGFSAPWA